MGEEKQKDMTAKIYYGYMDTDCIHPDLKAIKLCAEAVWKAFSKFDTTEDADFEVIESKIKEDGRNDFRYSTLAVISDGSNNT